MTEEELRYFESWLTGERVGNAYIQRTEDRLTGTELACEHVRSLLDEVKRLQSTGERADEREECAKIAEGQPLYPKQPFAAQQGWVMAEIARKIRERGLTP